MKKSQLWQILARLGLVFALCASLSSAQESADSSDMPQIHPKDFYAFATIADSKVSAAFGKITNHTTKPVALTKAELLGKNTATIELHESAEKDGVKTMQQVERIEIPAEGTIELAPGGLHIMLIDLKSHLKEGKNISLKLYFDDGSTAIVEAPIKARGHHQDSHATPHQESHH